MSQSIFVPITSNLNYPNNRMLGDAQLQAVQPLPAANSTLSSGFLFIGQHSFPASKDITFQATFPAMPNNLSTGDSVKLQWQHSPDGSIANAVNIYELATETIPGVATVGSAAITLTMVAPVDMYPYVRAQISATANVGNIANLNAVIGAYI